jgi:hypothetical protein
MVLERSTMGAHAPLAVEIDQETMDRIIDEAKSRLLDFFDNTPDEDLPFEFSSLAGIRREQIQRLGSVLHNLHSIDEINYIFRYLVEFRDAQKSRRAAYVEKRQFIPSRQLKDFEKKIDADRIKELWALLNDD